MRKAHAHRGLLPVARMGRVGVAAAGASRAVACRAPMQPTRVHTRPSDRAGPTAMGCRCDLRSGPREHRWTRINPRTTVHRRCQSLVVEGCWTMARRWFQRRLPAALPEICQKPRYAQPHPATQLNPRQRLSPAELCGHVRRPTALRTLRASMVRMGSRVRCSGRQQFAGPRHRWRPSRRGSGA